MHLKQCLHRIYEKKKKKKSFTLTSTLHKKKMYRIAAQLISGPSGLIFTGQGGQVLFTKK